MSLSVAQEGLSRLESESSLASWRPISNFVIYLHPFYFLVPWGGTSFGAFKALNVLFIALCVAAFFDFLRYGLKRPSLKFFLLTAWFTISFTLGLTIDLVQNDPVKTGFSPVQILADSAPFADAFLVYYLLQNNEWRQEDFDRLLALVYWIAFAVAVESVVVYYLGIPTGTEKYSLDGNLAFHSLFIQRRAVSGRLGIILAILAVYFWLRRENRNYLWGCVLGFLLVLSGHSRFAMLALILGFTFIFFCFLWGRLPATRNAFFRSVFALAVAPITLAALLFGIAMLGNTVRVGYGDISSLQRSFTLRAFDYSRALDIFASRLIFGGGPREGYYYGFYEHTPSVVSHLMFGDIRKFDFHHGWAELDLFREDPLEGRRYSIHGIPVNILVDFGLLGLLILSMLAWDAAMMVRYSLRLSRARDRCPSAAQFFAVFGLCIATGLSTVSTQKFFPYWLFAVMLRFLFYMYRQTRAEIAHSGR